MGKSLKLLDPKLPSDETIEFERALRGLVVGQDRAVRSLVKVMEHVRAGFNEPHHTLANLLFLGPSGSGKTHLVESLAQVLYGSTKALLKVDCGEFTHSHEMAKLIGSPPGYLGHRETQPIITQEVLEQHYTDKHKISILLFDEIEKAHYEFTNVLLGMLDRAGLTLGDNRRVSFASTIVFMTSNAGVRDITKALSGGIGYRATATAEEDERTDKKVYDAAKAALSRQFTAEFLNRIDKTIVFRALSDEEMGRVLDVELARVQESIMVSSTSRQFVFTCTPAARKFLLKEGFDPKYGARHLRRAIRRLLSNPLASLVGSGQIQFGDLVAVDYKQNSGELQFSLTPAAALVTKGAE